jgi:hypothetical protein
MGFNSAFKGLTNCVALAAAAAAVVTVIMTIKQ